MLQASKNVKLAHQLPGQSCDCLDKIDSNFVFSTPFRFQVWSPYGSDGKTDNHDL